MNHRILSIPLQSLYMSADAEPIPGGYQVPERGMLHSPVVVALVGYFGQ